jgi:4a-hydroxytetrahydrobiopterin dehydratase
MTTEELTAKKCQPCEGGVPLVPRDEVVRLLESLPGWELTDDGLRIRREWVVKNFMHAMDFFRRVADLAEEEGHHPDLHLVGYHNAAIELWTHAIGGISVNDFILAAKIDQLPVQDGMESATASIIVDLRTRRCSNCKIALLDELAEKCPACSASFDRISSNHVGLAVKLRKRREAAGISFE